MRPAGRPSAVVFQVNVAGGEDAECARGGQVKGAAGGRAEGADRIVWKAALCGGGWMKRDGCERALLVMKEGAFAGEPEGAVMRDGDEVGVAGERSHNAAIAQLDYVARSRQPE